MLYNVDRKALTFQGGSTTERPMALGPRNRQQGNDPLPVKRAVKKYKVSRLVASELLDAFYAARYNTCFSIGVSTPKFRCTLLVL